MVSYDEAVAIIQDPQADPVMLAKVAYENPEFGANVAAHAHAYPGLKRWLAQFGDERARRMVAQMGYESPLGPVEDREAGDTAGSAAAGAGAGVASGAATGGAGAAVNGVFDAAVASPTVSEVDAAGADVNAAEPAAMPVSFEPQQHSGVEMLDERFSALPDESVLPSYPVEANGAASAAAVDSGRTAAQEPQQSEPVATNAYGFTAQQAATTNDPAVMQQIAQYAPELHVALAGNPYLYPELRAWLGMLGNPAVNDVLAHRQ